MLHNLVFVKVTRDSAQSFFHDVIPEFHIYVEGGGTVKWLDPQRQYCLMSLKTLEVLSIGK